MLTAFLFQDQYEEKLLNDTKTRCELTRDIIRLVARYAGMETALLLQLHDADSTVPLFDLSERTSEEIFSLQNTLVEKLDVILKEEELVWQVMEHYIPSVLITKLGRDSIMALFGSPELQPYRDAIVTKKLASMAFYRFGQNWGKYLKELKKDFPKPLYKALQQKK